MHVRVLVCVSRVLCSFEFVRLDVELKESVWILSSPKMSVISLQVQRPADDVQKYVYGSGNALHSYFKNI